MRIILLVRAIMLSMTMIYNTHAKERPLWEMGVGLMNFRLNHYRGAKGSKWYHWPIPYFIYRGEKIQAENSVITGKLELSERVSLGASISAGLRVNSQKAQARQGMPNLDYSFEAGPQLRWDIFKGDRKYISLVLPLRTVLTARDLNFRHIGQFSVPYLALTFLPQDSTKNTYLGFSLAYMHGSSEYHNYFYGVDPLYQTAFRPSYSANGGMSGIHGTFYISKKWKNLYIFTFGRFDDLSKAVFRHSPLVEQKRYKVFGIGFISYLFSSKEMSKNKRYRR